MAVRAARAAGLHNAATAEFLFDADRRFWFLEVNARLQVEHGVTELVTDLDLVARAALDRRRAGRCPSASLAAAAAAATPTRHAIEVRLSAEDPARDFAPGAGPDRPLDDAGRPGRPGRYRDRGGRPRRRPTTTR